MTVSYPLNITSKAYDQWVTKRVYFQACQHRESTNLGNSKVQNDSRQAIGLYSIFMTAPRLGGNRKLSSGYLFYHKSISPTRATRFTSRKNLQQLLKAV